KIGFLSFLFRVLEWTRPGLPSPLRPICDLRVLNHFIQEARDAEVAMKSCREGCGLTEAVSVPQTTVNFDDWEKKNAMEQAQEVQTGLWLLQQALSLLRTSMTNSELNSHIDNVIRNLHSITAVLRSLNFQRTCDFLNTSAELQDNQLHVTFNNSCKRSSNSVSSACTMDILFRRTKE
uniref:Erythropoietin n=1 Tax=Xiphophorus couchianus TaxID=32473 RepID=A0A3B5KNN6_9TELE